MTEGRKRTRGRGLRGKAPLATRLLAAVLLAAGLALLAEAALTVVWQEPVSRFQTNRAQRSLARELAAIEQQPVALPAPRSEREEARPQRPPVALLARALARRSAPGDPVGRITIPKLGTSFVVVEGTDDAHLTRGPGHYRWTALPGQGRTVGIAGHRTTYAAPFREIDRLENGDLILMRMPYGLFRYRVEGSAIVEPEADYVLRRVRHERLVLTSCHPLFSQAQRIVVFARLVAQQPTRAVPA